MRQRAEQSARASQVERASERQASHLVSQPASLLKSGPAANLPASLPVSISQPASQAKPAVSQPVNGFVLLSVALLYESPGENQVGGLLPVPTY